MENKKVIKGFCMTEKDFENVELVKKKYGLCAGSEAMRLALHLTAQGKEAMK